MRLPPLNIKILLESNPPQSRVSLRTVGRVHGEAAPAPALWQASHEAFFRLTLYAMSQTLFEVCFALFVLVDSLLWSPKF